MYTWEEYAGNQQSKLLITKSYKKNKKVNFTSFKCLLIKRVNKLFINFRLHLFLFLILLLF